jgi:GH24 family phage-related lysozyme (muramidase)
MATTALTAAALAAALYLGKMAAQAKIISTLEAAKDIGGAGGDTKTNNKGPRKPMGKFGKSIGPAAGLLAVGVGAMNATEGYNDAEDQVKKGEITKEEGTVKKSEAVGKGVGEGLGGAGGAALGAAIGTFIFPVVGTAIGAAFGGWLGSMGGEAIGESVGNTVGKELAKKPVVATAAAKASAKESGSSGSSTPVAMGNEGRRGSPSSAPVASAAPAPAAPAVATSTPKASGSDGTGASEKVNTGSKAPPKAMAKAGGSMSDEDIKKMIIKHEGIRNKPYKDSLGLWTVGVGHLIGDGYKGQSAPPPEWNREFSNEEVMKMFDEDYAHHKSAAMKIPGYDKVDSKGQGALTDLTFNMGPSWISKWPKLKKQLGEGDTQAAASNLQESKWYGQVGNRAPTIVSLLKDSGGGNVSANLEGIAEGPESGYAATLHGTEIIKRLTKDSILDKLANTPAGDMFSSNSAPMDNSELVDLMKMFVEKMDNLIDAQSDSNSIQSELLQYSKV